MKVKDMVKYSAIKKKLNIEVEKIENDGMAHLTHYFQNHQNGISQHFKNYATDFLGTISKQLNILEEPQIQLQQFLPLKFDVPFPPPEEYDFTFICQVSQRCC